MCSISFQRYYLDVKAPRWMSALVVIDNLDGLPRRHRARSGSDHRFSNKENKETGKQGLATGEPGVGWTKDSQTRENRHTHCHTVDRTSQTPLGWVGAQFIHFVSQSKGTPPSLSKFC